MLAGVAAAFWHNPTNKLAGLDTSSTQAVISVCHRAAPARPYGRARPLSGCILDRCAGQTTAWCPAFAPTRNKRLPKICSVVMARCKSNVSWNSTALLLASFRDTSPLSRCLGAGLDPPHLASGLPERLLCGVYITSIHGAKNPRHSQVLYLWISRHTVTKAFVDVPFQDVDVEITPRECPFPSDPFCRGSPVTLPRKASQFRGTR